jgi:Uma2 family endonuclease
MPFSTGSQTGARNSRLVMRLLLWADQQGGWKVFDSSTGFRLPDGSVLSPDASMVRLDRWQAPIPKQQAVEIWSAGDAAPQRLAPAQWLDADDLLPGLRIDLAELWAG